MNIVFYIVLNTFNIFSQVIEGFEDPNQKYILDLFLQLSYTNKSLMLLGDSMNNQVWSALFIEVQRERIKGIISLVSK